MVVDVSTEIVIAQPRAKVARFAADPQNAPAWYENIKSVEWKTPVEVAVGSRIAFVAHFLGRRMTYIYEIVEYDHDERLVMRTAEGPFPMETIYTGESVAGGTRKTLRNHGVPAGFSALAAPLMSIAMRRANKKDLAKLKRVLGATTAGDFEPGPPEIVSL
jgi:hypothetical protein